MASEFSLLEDGDDKMPLRVCVDPESPYFCDDFRMPPMVLTFNGVYLGDFLPQKRLYEYDRREGWVVFRDEQGNLLPREYGEVTTTLPNDWAYLLSDPDDDVGNDPSEQWRSP